MQEISLWADTVCGVAVICALCEMVIPSGNLAKVFHFVLGIFLIVAILVPFSDMVKSGITFQNDFPLEQNHVTLSGIDDLSIAYGKTVIENLISQTLEENEMEYKKIEIDMDSTQGDSIDIIRVKIYTDISERNELKEYQRVVKEKTGIQPDIYAE